MEGVGYARSAQAYSVLNFDKKNQAGATPNAKTIMTLMWARVAVIIVNFNSGVLLARCLGQLRAQTQSPERVIVVDNASEDASADSVETDYPGAELIRLQQNVGFSAANNLAVRQAGEVEWGALLNPDAFPEPDWLEQLLCATRNDPDCASFGSRMIDARDPTRLDGTGDIYHTSGLVWRRHHGRLIAAIPCEKQEIFSACAAAAFYRRDAFSAAGGFDEDYFCYCEDVDLGFRLQLLGYRCRYVPDAVVRHIGSALTGRHSAFSLYHGHRNLVWTWFKNMPGPLLWLYLPQHLLLTVFEIFYFACRGQGEVLLRAKWEALQGLSHCWRKRQKIQKQRLVSCWQLRRKMDRGLLSLYRRLRRCQ